MLQNYYSPGAGYALTGIVSRQVGVNMKKLFRRTGKADVPRRDSFLQRDTYWDEEDDQEYDWDSAEEEEESVEEIEDEDDYESPDSSGVEYEALEEGADGVFEPEEKINTYKEQEDMVVQAEAWRLESDAYEQEEGNGGYDSESDSGFYEQEENADSLEEEKQNGSYDAEDGRNVFYTLSEDEDSEIVQEDAGEYSDFESPADEYDESETESDINNDYYEDETEYEAEEGYRQQETYNDDSDYNEAAWPDDLNGPDDSYRRLTGKSASRAEKSAAKRKPAPRRQESLLEKIGSTVRSMETMDRIMVVTGVAVLLMAIVTGAVFIRINTTKRQISGFAEVGRQLEGINLIGENGLLAVANVRLAKASGAVPDGDEASGGYDETGYARDVSVEPNFTSIQKDLKIKFINRNTDKLVGNVPFSVTVTDPDGKSAIWSDDDMDGIIHKKDITPGIYQVAMEPLTDEKYSGYTVFTDSQSVEVKKEIAYEKVNVANEVKKESEVNVAQEDTRKNETVVESTLKDTVAWVESKVISATYNEVAKSTIPDPVTLAAIQRALYLSVEEAGTMPVTEEGGTLPDTPTEPVIPDDTTAQTEPPAVEETVAPPATEEPATPPPATEEPPTTPPVTGEPATPPPATEEPPTTPPVTGEPTTPPDSSAAPTQEPVPEDPSVTATPDVPSQTQSPGQDPGTSSPQDPGTALTKGSVSVTPATLNAALGTTLAAKATAGGFTGGYKIVYAVSSSNAAVASATINRENGDINISALAAGTATLTVTANYENGTADTQALAMISINVAGSTTLTLDKANLTVYAEVPAVINAKVTNGATVSPILTVESSDTGIAAVSVDRTAITITGVAEGTANITVKYNSGSQELSAVCSVTVKKHPREDNVTLLKDADGQQLYVLEGTAYREAVRADYYTADKFFIKGEARYSGWQTLEGRVYYFNADGSKVTGEQVIQGAKYNFASDGSLVTGSNGTMGIDVSKWNGKIDWNAVKNSGVSYVIIRCGYRGSAQGSLIEDPRFETNIQGAIAAGLKVGVYFFTQAVDEMEAVEEASMVLDQIKNYKISYPVFLDVEASGGRADKIDKAARTAVCKAFCQTIQNGGYTAGIYANKTWLESRIDTGSLSAYKIWLAQYAASPTYRGRYDLWQYRSTGSVSGISGNVDFNISYLGY
ncbi:MAG TPA: hypothetical protein DCZ91_12125 [Lachnospiraceae bacterium]|nr:hypothetical protein [Lachnospiraceae bacterium]